MVQCCVSTSKFGRISPRNCQNTPQEHFLVLLKDEDFVSRSISDGSVDLDMFPASRVQQLAKKLESSKATTRHIKQVSGEPQATQINLLRHQRTELPQHRYKKKRSYTKPMLGNNKSYGHNQYQSQISQRNKADHKLAASHRLAPSNNFNRCLKCGDTAHHEGFTCPAKTYQCKACHKFGHFTSQCFQKRQQSQYQSRWPKAHQIMADEIHNTLDNYQSDISSSEDSFCLQVKIHWKQDGVQAVPKPTYLITNIAYQLKQHHIRNQYLRARIDMCADVNIMPISVYRLLYHDGDLKKLTPSWLQVGTYTTDTVKIIGTCKIYLVHPDCNKPNKATFYVASNEGSVLLSCDTSLTFGLIHQGPRLDYLPPKASLIMSSAEHPRKTKEQLQIQKHEITEQTTKPKNNMSQAPQSQSPSLLPAETKLCMNFPMCLRV